jgi:RsiW-degrading membrane proteinase PrsW (M82 family)
MENQQKNKWYFKNSALIAAFFCLGPLALPLLWRNPHYNNKVKIIITIVVIIVTYVLTVALSDALKSISQYYKQISNPTF